MRFLPRACAGEIIGGICMSEPSGGTDVMAMKSFAKPTADGNHWILNGNKLWITNGTIDGTDTGDAFIVYAKTDLSLKDGGLTAFIVEKGMPGFTLGRQIKDKLGNRASPTAELYFTDVKIPVENILGGVGKGVTGMMRNLEIERVASGAYALGIARRSIEIMSKYSQERKAFGKPISEYGQVITVFSNIFYFLFFFYCFYFFRGKNRFKKLSPNLMLNIPLVGLTLTMWPEN
jgi:isovaleryl-CoA dehydrogenase